MSRARGMKEERERERDISKVYHRGLNLRRIMINGFTISNGKTNSRVECVCICIYMFEKLDIKRIFRGRGTREESNV